MPLAFQFEILNKSFKHYSEFSWYQRLPRPSRPSPSSFPGFKEFFPFSGSKELFSLLYSLIRMASSSTMFQLPNLAQSNSAKLDSTTTYLPWLSTVVPILKSHELLGIADSSEPCPPALLTDE